MVAKIGSKAPSSSGLPAMLVKIWMPAAPSSLTARRASLTEPSTSVITPPRRRSESAAGWRAHNSAMASLPIARQLEADGAGREVLDRRVRQRDDLAVVAELVHLAKALVEIEQLLHAAQPRRRCCRAAARCGSSPGRILRDDVAVDVDDGIIGHGVPHRPSATEERSVALHLRGRARASQYDARPRIDAAAPSCFETHRSWLVVTRHACVCAAMLLSDEAEQCVG